MGPSGSGFDGGGGGGGVGSDGNDGIGSGIDGNDGRWTISTITGTFFSFLNKLLADCVNIKPLLDTFDPIDNPNPAYFIPNTGLLFVEY